METPPFADFGIVCSVTCRSVGQYLHRDMEQNMESKKHCVRGILRHFGPLFYLSLVDLCEWDKKASLYFAP